MVIKRLFDIVVACIALVLLAPVFLVAALLIVLETRGPIFSQARRIGRGGSAFRLYTFRTLLIDAVPQEATGAVSWRYTHAGQVLRAAHLDGLPQLFNVLKGDMSLVGPQPEVPEYVHMNQLIWRQVLAVRPGIFGLAQLTFAFDEAMRPSNPAVLDRDYMLRILPVKLHLDMRYVMHQSLLLDLTLLAQTSLLLVRPSRRVSVV